jgi:hypothetical protein
VLAELSRTRVERQQLIDMLADNSYRESLVVRAGSNVCAEPDFQAELEAAQISTLLLLRDGEQGTLQIRNHRGWQTSVSEPLVKDAVVALTQASPRALTLADLAKGLDVRGRAALGRGLFDLFAAGFIDLRRDPPRCAIRPGARPQASALCRWQSTHRVLLTDVYHYSVKVQEERSRRLIGLLDGTRDRAALVADWSSFGTASEVDDYLDRFAKLRLLVA